jgi:hypothetical protein
MKMHPKNQVPSMAILGFTILISSLSQAWEVDTSSNFAEASKGRDGVVQHYDKDTNRIFTYMPLVDNWENKEEIIEAYQQAQEFAKQAVVDWASQAYASKDASQLNEDELAKVQAWSARIRSGEIDSTNINKALVQEGDGDSVQDVLSKLHSWQDGKADLGAEIDAFAKIRNSAFAIKKADPYIDYIIPTAVMGFVSVKTPQWIIKMLAQMPRADKVFDLNKLLNGSATFSVSYRVWLVTITDGGSPDPDHHVIRGTKNMIHFERAFQFWMTSDVVKNAPAGAPAARTLWDRKVRVGTGLIFGPIDNLQTLSGVFGGGAVEGSFSKTNPYLGSSIKVGVIAGLAPGTGQPTFNNVYAMFGWQKNDPESIATASLFTPHLNYGYVVPLDALGSFMYSFVSGITGGTTLSSIAAYFGLGPAAVPTVKPPVVTPPGPNPTTAHDPAQPAKTPDQPSMDGTPATANQHPFYTPPIMIPSPTTSPADPKIGPAQPGTQALAKPASSTH